MADAVLVTGSIGLDTVETPQGKLEDCLGGSATYFALAAGFFCPVRVVAAVGEDFPDSHRRKLQQRRIDLAGLETRQGAKTFKWHGKYSRDMNSRQTLDVQLNVLAEPNPDIPPAFRETEYVFLANDDPVGQLEVLDKLSNPRVVVCDTIDLWISQRRQELLQLLGRCHGLVINDDEARSLSGEENLINAARWALALGLQFVVVKKGEHGSLMVSSDGVFLLPAYPTENVVDPTGAGDSFAGGLMGYLAGRSADPDPDNLRQALLYATLVASFTVESFSVDGLLSMDRQKLHARRDQFLQMLTVPSQ